MAYHYAFDPSTGFFCQMVSTLGNIDLNRMSHRYVSGVLQMTEMIPLTSAHLIDRSKDAIFELVCVIKWSILSFPVYITKKMSNL